MKEGTSGQGGPQRGRLPVPEPHDATAPTAPSIDPLEILVATPLFAGLPADDLAALAARCRRRDVTAGQPVLREGDLGNGLYVLVRGRLRVDAGELALHEIRPGDLFGEIAVVTGKPRTTSIYAVRDSELLVLPAAAFEELVERKPAILREVSRVLVDRLLTVERPVAAGDASLVVAVVPVTTHPELLEESLRELLRGVCPLREYRLPPPPGPPGRHERGGVGPSVRVVEPVRRLRRRSRRPRVVHLLRPTG